MGVNVQVLDEKGLPVHCSVAAVRTSDQTILNTYVTDETTGVVNIAEAGVWYPRPLVDPVYKNRLRLVMLNKGNAALYDYVVDSSGGGTHLTVRAMMADFIAAAEATPTTRLSCWVARDDTDTNIDWGSETNIGSAVLTIEGAGASSNRTFLKFPGGTNGDAYFKTAHRYTPIIVFRGLKVGGGVSTNDGSFMSDTFTGSPSSVQFSNCELACATLNNRNPVMLMVGQSSLPTLTFEDCTGSASALLSGTGISFQYLTVQDCRMTLNQLVISDKAPVLHINGGELTFSTTGFNPANGNDSTAWSMQGVKINYNGSGTCFSKSSGQTNDCVTSFSNIRFQATNSAAKFANISGSGVANDSFFCDSLFLIGAPGAAGPALTIGSGMDNVFIGVVNGLNWTTLVSGDFPHTAPTNVDYLVGTASGELSNEIVVGTTPGGELGGTWASPTVDATHSGSAHHTQDHASRHAQGAADVLDVADLGSGAAASGTIPQADGTGGVAWVAGGGAAIVPFLHDSAVSVWTNMPAAKTELFGTTLHRTKVDLTNVTGVTFVVNVQTAGVAGSKLRIEYSTDEINWAYLVAASSGPEVTVDATGVKTSGAVNIDSGAKANVFLRVVGISGDGAVDPAFGSISLIAGGASGGGGGGAPTTAKYVTTAADATLSAELVLTQLTNKLADSYPASPTAYDDEFDDTTGNSGTGNGLNARWAWHDQGSTAINYPDQGFARIYHTGSPTQWAWIGQTVPAGDWTFETKLALVSGGLTSIICKNGTAGTHYELGLIYGNAGIRCLGMRLGYSAGTYSWQATFTGGGTDALIWGQNVAYMRISYVAATKVLIFWISTDGISWVNVGTQTAANAITDIGIGIGNGTTPAGKFDYFRKVA